MASEGIAVSSGPAARYAAALYSYASDQQRLASVTTNMERLGQAIDSSTDLRRLLESPLTNSKDAQRALGALVRSLELGSAARRLVDVLITNRRLPLLHPITEAFAALVAEKRGVTAVKVASAHPLSDVQEQQLRARLIELGYGNVSIDRKVDSSLLGGIVVRVGARLYDTSLKSRLQRLQYAMKGAA